MKKIFYLILFFIFNISYSSIDNNKIESYKYSLEEKDSIIQSEDYYPHNLTDKDSFNYPLKVGVELNIVDLKDLTLKSNYFFTKFDFALYTQFDTIYVSKLKDTIKLDPARFVRVDYDESDRNYYDIYIAERIEISDSIEVLQQPGYVENIFYHKWDLRNYPFDTQKLKINFITERDTSELRLNENIYLKSSYNKNIENLIDGYTITGLDFTTGFRESSFLMNTKQGKRKEILEYISYQINISRDGSFLYFKLFFGTFLSFLISYLVFFIDKKEFETRITLSVGGIFGAVGNRYFVESIMPEVQVLTKGDLINNLVILLIVMNIFIVIMQYNKDINWDYIRGNKNPAIFSAFVFTILNLIIIYF
jgi:hypothetical protein